MTVALVDKIAWPVSSNYSIKPSVDTVGKGGYNLLATTSDPDAVIEALFASGEEGAWYDPSDFSTMFQDSAGTTPVTAVGQPVGKILDKSGRNNHATQATAASRPMLQIDGNGKYYLEVDGVDDFMSAASVNVSQPDTITTGIFVITTYQVGIQDGLTTRQLIEINRGGSNRNVELFAGVDEVGGGVQITLNQQNVMTFIFNGASSVIRNNGTAGSTINPGSNAINSLVFPRMGSGSFLQGRIYAYILRGALSTEQEITDSETWVAGKTGVTI